MINVKESAKGKTKKRRQKKAQGGDFKESACNKRVETRAVFSGERVQRSVVCRSVSLRLHYSVLLPGILHKIVTAFEFDTDQK
ncbi:hypothetical protein B9Z55_010019 [Caenorhabditis nigoni]|uniref:Uncharacterized protein n=1 Tax=Caenorhabditis nigoni TaxID=1611254 RepID=A0A2G5UE80_9PELO|nr:hypothetical protein B9Z55_010019 [Caenorhabditis nigoni]